MSATGGGPVKAAQPEHAPLPRVAASKGNKRGGRRGRVARELHRHTVRAINATAEERLAARLDREPHPNVEYATTKRLGELFDERRDETAGTLTDPYYGATMRAGRGRSA